MPIIPGEQFFGGKPGQVIQDAFGTISPVEITQKPGYFQRVGQGLKQTFTGLKSDLETQAETIAGEQLKEKPSLTKEAVALGRGGLRTVGAAAQAVFTPLTEAPGIKQGLEFIGGKLAETTPIQKFQEWAGKHPEAAKDIMDVADIAGLLGAKGVAQPLGQGVKKTIQAAVETTGQAVKAITPKFSSVGQYTAGRLPKLLGIFSGENDDIIRKALTNPKVANLGIEQGDDALRKAVQEGAENSVKIRNTFVQAHSQAKKQIFGQYDKVAVPKNDIKGIFNKLLEKNNVKVSPEGLDFSVSKIAANPGEISKIKTAWEGLDKWGQFTLGSVDDYKQFVGKLRRFADEAGVPSKSPFLGEFYNELNKVITVNKRIPLSIRQQYMTLNKNFSNLIELYDDVVDAFNSGDPFTKLANALGKNKDTLRQTLEFYEKQSGKKVLPLVAGRELAMEKTAAFGFLNPRSWIDFLISPKIQAKIITGIGGKFPKITKKVTQ